LFCPNDFKILHSLKENLTWFLYFITFEKLLPINNCVSWSSLLVLEDSRSVSQSSLVLVFYFRVFQKKKLSSICLSIYIYKLIDLTKFNDNISFVLKKMTISVINYCFEHIWRYSVILNIHCIKNWQPY